MTHPLTPCEKVELKPCPFCGGDAVAGSNFDNDHYVMCGADCDRCGGMVGYMKTEMAAIENWNRRTALASGSGDHAELARLADMADWMADGDPGANGSVLLSASVASEHAADLRAILAENAALRAESENARTVVAWANNSLFGSCGYFHGEPFDGLHLARPIEALKTQATEAERKLAEADKALELAAIRLDEIYEAAEVDDVAYRNEATIHSINGLAGVAQAEIRTFLSSKEAERG